MIRVEVEGRAIPQGSMSAIPFHKPCSKCAPGKPCGRPRMCLGGRELGANVVHGNDKELKAWRGAIADAARAQIDRVAAGTDNLAAWARARPCAPAGSVTIGIRAVFDRPQGHWTSTGVLSADGLANPEPWHKPDADKLLRGGLDALKDLVYTDDAQVVWLVVEKAWALRSESPRAVILIAPGRKLVEVAAAIEAMRPPTTPGLFG